MSGWNLPPGVTTADIDRAYGFDRPEYPEERCSNCGAFLPERPARGFREEEQWQDCDGKADKAGWTACTGSEGWTGGDHKPHSFTLHWARLALHSCRRCGKDVEVIRDAI